MKNTMIKAAAAVPVCKVADPVFNTDEIIRLMKEHADCGLIVFPELCITGYTCGDLFAQHTLLAEALEQLERIADTTSLLSGLTAVVSLPLEADNAVYSCTAIVSQGEIKALIPKTSVPSYGEFAEGRWFAPGRNVTGKTVRISGKDIPFGSDILAEDTQSGAVIGAEAGEDLWIPDSPGARAAEAGANIIVSPAASNEIIGREEYRRMYVSTKSASYCCDYIYVSAGMCESTTDMVFSGHAIIADSGRIRKECIFPELSHTETVLLDIEKCMYNRRRRNTFDSGAPLSYRRVSVSAKNAGGSEISTVHLRDLLLQEDYPVSRYPFVPADDAERERRCGRILQIQANGLATRLRAIGVRTLILGVSGGLDSTLALIVCHETQKLLNDVRIIGYTMPNEGNTTSLTYNNALNLMKALNIEVREVPIGKGVRSHLIDIGHPGEYQGEGDVTYENAQARMRTYILMDAANIENGLVVGTGDLSELALGWCTYNGDHMAMYGVNASVPKTLVKYICRTYAYTCNDENLKSVLLSIADTPISPELTPNKDGEIAQKTEEKIGKYDLNDFFMYYALRYGFEPEKIMAFAMRAYPETDMESIREAMIRFYSRFFHQQFKRSCMPDGPKAGSITLSPRGDWHMPSDASVSLWLEKIRNA